MNYEELRVKKVLYQEHLKRINAITLESYERAFEVAYTHNSTAKDIHAITMERIYTGGIYRNVDVYISGARHTPPVPNQMFTQVKSFYADLAWKGQEMNPIEYAAWTHAEFVKIHPLEDGNGRTSRLLINYQLMANGFPAINIAKERRLQYFDTLEAYAVNGELVPFCEMIAELALEQMERYLGMR